jgi:hypothetical protein
MTSKAKHVSECILTRIRRKTNEFRQRFPMPRMRAVALPNPTRIVAASRRYVGKETDRRWEQGEDLSLVKFTSFEYQQSQLVIGTDEIKQEIIRFGIRKLERKTGISHHTIDKILKGGTVRRKTLARAYFINRFGLMLGTYG